MFVLLSVFTFSQIPLNGLIAYYPFTDGSLDNFAGNYSNIDSNIMNCVIDTSIGIYNTIDNSTYHFDGSSYMNIVPSSNINPYIHNSITYTGWFKIDYSGNDYGIFSIDGSFGGNNPVHSLGIFFNHLRFIFGSGSQSYVESNSIILQNHWYFFTICDSINYVKLYLNGILQDSSNYSPLFLANATNYRLGSYYNNIINYLLGSIDEFRIYNRLLDSTEISQLYADTIYVPQPLMFSILQNQGQDTTFTITPPNFKTSNHIYNFYDENGMFLDSVSQGSSYITLPLHYNDTTKYFITTTDSSESNPVSVTIYRNDSVFVNCTYTPFTITTNIKESTCTSMKIYPNPTTDYVDIILEKENIVYLYSIEGSLITQIKGKNLKFDLTDLPKGVYLIKTDKSVSKIVKI